jgi:RND family efflux transporter MFP subunit
MKNFLKKKKVLLMMIVVIIAVIAVFNVKNNKAEPVIAANVSHLEKKTIEQTISVKAPLEGIEKADVVSPLNYEILDIKVKEGDIVKKDQILAVLDSEELEKEIDAAGNQIQLAQLEQQEKLKATQVEYDKAMSKVAELEKSFNQNKELLENEIITQETFEEIENNLNEAKKGLESFNASDGKVNLSEAEVKDVEIKKQELEKKKEDLDKVYIRSPIDGTVTRVNVNLGRYAKDTEDEKAMFVVENLNKLQMKVLVSEFDVGKIKTGQQAEISSDIMGADNAEGVVARISPTAEQKDNNSMERVIPVLIDITERPESLMAGVIATAQIKVGEADDVFAVPTGAILEDENGQDKIFAVNDDGSVKSIAVETGMETDLETEITGSGLAEEMKIVVNPDSSYSDGMIVLSNEEGK